MANDQHESEIEILRAQIAELTAARKNEKNSSEEKTRSQESSVDSSGTEVFSDSTSVITNDISDSEKDDENDLEHQFQELIETIDTELKEASPVTVLAVFAVGILVGRLLPR